MSLEAESLCASREAEQARPLARRVDELADARQADRLAEVPRDHGQAGGAAIHLVELVDVRQATAPTAGERRRGRLELLRHRGVPRRGVTVGSIDSRNLGGQQLLCEVSWKGGLPPVVGKGRSLLDPLAELGVVVQQPADDVGAEGEEPARRRSLHGRFPPPVVKHGQFAEEVSGVEVLDDVAVPHDAQPAGRDEV